MQKIQNEQKSQNLNKERSLLKIVTHLTPTLVLLLLMGAFSPADCNT